MRKINDDEIIKISEAFTDMFRDYDAYRLFFDEKHLLSGIRAFFLYEVFTAKNYTYTDGDCAVVASVKLPSDKDVSSALFFDDPVLSREFFNAVDDKTFALAEEYVDFNKSLAGRHYDPSTDCYVKNIGVKKQARGKGLLRKTLSALCGDRPVYLETHSEENVKIYEKLGFFVVERADFHGVTVFAMSNKKSGQHRPESSKAERRITDAPGKI